MHPCDTCGNSTEAPMELTRSGRTGHYDSFECAIHAMAERCAHCDCAILGHAVHHEGRVYCCQHCTSHQ